MQPYIYPRFYLEIWSIQIVYWEYKNAEILSLIS